MWQTGANWGYLSKLGISELWIRWMVQQHVTDGRKLRISEHAACSNKLWMARIGKTAIHIWAMNKVDDAVACDRQAQIEDIWVWDIWAWDIWAWRYLNKLRISDLWIRWCSTRHVTDGRKLRISERLAMLAPPPPTATSWGLSHPMVVSLSPATS